MWDLRIVLELYNTPVLLNFYVRPDDSDGTFPPQWVKAMWGNNFTAILSEILISEERQSTAVDPDTFSKQSEFFISWRREQCPVRKFQNVFLILVFAQPKVR